jgi:hypothetical protein
MGRKILMILLGAGAIAGFASGFARLHHGSYRHFGHGVDGRSEFEERVADTCTESALRVYRGQASKPGQAP